MVLAANRNCLQYKFDISFKRNIIKMILLLATIVSVLNLTSSKGIISEKVCDSMEITPKSHYLLHKLASCDVIEGSLSISNINFQNIHIYTPLREITGYLLVYRVNNLETLGNVFPNLTVIRGNELLGKYSFIIHENGDLENIGLSSLIGVLKGSIRITKNPVLCYVLTVNWIYLLSNSVAQHFVVRYNQNVNHCPQCVMDSGGKMGTGNHCWDYKTPQKICPKNCPKGSCSPEGECCHESCLGNCTKAEGRQCKMCRDFKSEDGSCVDRCAATSYNMNNRLCVSAFTCEDNKLLPYQGVCGRECPSGWFFRNNKCRKCQDFCVVSYCNGGSIRTTIDAKFYLNCTVVKGSLDIQLVQKKDNIVADLEMYLRDIIEIRGYLRVWKSPQLTSLTFFKSLRKIKGEELLGDKYSLYLTDNYHMEHIWNNNQTIDIENGKLFVHFNPKLCYEKIEELIPSMKNYTRQNLSLSDVSPTTNGDQVVCKPNIQNLEVKVEDKNSTAVRLKLEPIIFEDKRIFLGYIFYYRITTTQNVTIYDSRHGCGFDKWKNDLDLSKNVRHIITNLKPFTQYAYFVKTFTVTNLHDKMDAFSPVQYFETLSGKPGPITKLFSYVSGESEVELHWWPPSPPNGRIQYYLLDVAKTSFYDSHKEVEIKNINLEKEPNEAEYDNVEVEIYNKRILDTKYNISRNCNCTEESWRGYEPIYHEYYDEAETIFEDAVVDFAYVSKESSVSNVKLPEINESIPPISAKDKEEEFERHIEEARRKAITEYDTGVNDFEIIKSRQTCDFGICLQKEKPQTEKLPKTTVVLTGLIHHYIVKGLDPTSKYKITIRGCVNGCLSSCGTRTSLMYR